MGKGDVKTKRGKIWRGSYGVKRPKLTNQHRKPANPANE
ncbi:30S ribosomal protein THX [Larkinella bovis]|uniref:30S ribosomal protein THX n=1 Tax=Larkinella bovis TaxID=683041 RepID=A0ABW0IBA6_9BACT